MKIIYNNGKTDGIKEQIIKVETKIEETKIVLHDVILVKRTDIPLLLVQKPDAINVIEKDILPEIVLMIQLIIINKIITTNEIISRVIIEPVIGVENEAILLKTVVQVGIR